MKKYIHTTLKGTLTAVVMMASVSVWAEVPERKAKIGTNEYTTLLEAINAATDGQTVELMANIEETVTYTINKQITIDFGTYTITASHTTSDATSNTDKVFDISAGGNLTVTGTTGGVQDATVLGIFNNAGTLTINGGHYTTTTDDYGVVYNNGGTCTIAGGNITGAYAAIYNRTGSVTVNGGTLSGAARGICAKSGTIVNIISGIISSSYVAVSGEASSTITISDGNITATEISSVYLEGTGAKATISGGTISAPWGVQVREGSSLTVSGGSISGTTASVYLTDDNSTATISGGTISGKDGISVWKKAALTVNDGADISGTNTAISGNGTPGDGGTTIVINGGTITNPQDVAIYHPQDGTLTISGGTITGTTALEVRSGIVSITDGTLTATGTPYSCEPNEGGTTTVGAALAIAQHTTKKDITVNISGGTFTGVKAISESNPQENYPAPQVTMTVTNGDFTGDITTADVKNFISGGTFHTQVDAEYCAEGFVLEDLGDDNYGVLYDMVLNDGANLSSFEEWNTKKVKATYTRNTGMVAADGTETKYGTICLPFEITAAIADVKLYKATEINASTLRITEVETIDAEHKIDAGTPLIFELTTAATTMTVISKNATVNTTVPSTEPVTSSGSENYLVGTYSAMNITSGLESIYYLNGDKFHQAKVSLAVPPYRAYLKNTTQGSARPTVISISHDGGDVTAITETEAWDTVSEVYDLNGRKQSGLQKGVNIMRRADGSSFRVIVK